MQKIYERQAKESAKAFAAFSEYMALGPERSLEVVRQRCGKSSRLIQRWSSRWSWTERVRAYDEHLAGVERQATEALAREKSSQWIRRQEEQRDDEWQTRNEALELARAAIGRWKANEKRCGSLEGIARLLDLASKLGRLASGMPTDKTEVTGGDGGAIRVELTAALDKIYGGAVDEVDSSVLPVPQGERDALPGPRANGDPVANEAPAALLSQPSENATA